jgi:hypothetical protein
MLRRYTVQGLLQGCGQSKASLKCNREPTIAAQKIIQQRHGRVVSNAHTSTFVGLQQQQQIFSFIQVRMACAVNPITVKQSDRCANGDLHAETRGP